MAWIQRNENGAIAAYVNIAPPSEDAPELWETVAEDSAEVVAYLAALFAPQPQPNWAGFREQISTSTEWMRIGTASPQCTLLMAGLIPVLWQLQADPHLAAEVKRIWDTVANLAAITPEEITALNAIAQSCGIPFSLDASGAMVFA